MAEQWIDALTAWSVAATPPDLQGGVIAFCERAHAGLIRARARVLLVGEERKDDIEVPRAFWWAHGHAGLQQNWSAGDFSTWIDHRLHLRAFGVTFALSDVLDLLPPEERALAARRCSVAGSDRWVTVHKAAHLINEFTRVTKAVEMLVEQARLGFLATRAVLAQRYLPSPHYVWRDLAKGNLLGKAVWEARQWDVPAWFWEEFTHQGHSDHDWETGNFMGRGMGPDGFCVMKLSSVHVLLADIEALRPAEVDGSELKVKTNIGGRPAQPWWDDLWCAVWGLIHQGDLKPKTQADVERAMLTWAAVNGHELSEAAVRPKARKLFKACKGEVTNFLTP